MLTRAHATDERLAADPAAGSPAGPGVLVEGITKRYGARTALDDVSIDVPAGSVLALLGPNGAGKTTLVRVLTTLIRPDRGRAIVAGHDVVARPGEVRRSIGPVGQHAAVDEYLTGRENLTLVARLLRFDRTETRGRVGAALETFGLADVADAPTAAHGTTVLLTTQYLEEADRLADTVAVIDHGRLIATGTPDDLPARLGGDTVHIRLADPADLPRATGALAELGATTAAERDLSGIGVRSPDGAALLPTALRLPDGHGVSVTAAEVRRPSLDDVFLALTGERAT